MSEELTKKKRVRGAHKTSATKIMQQIAEVVRSERPDQTKLSCLQLALNEKFETIKALGVQVIDLIDELMILKVQTNLKKQVSAHYCLLTTSSKA